MADKAPTLPPPSEPFPGSRTPGWNDPPPLLAAGVSTGRSRLNLNKRVAFPLQSGDTNITTTKPTAVVPPNQSAFSSSASVCHLPPLTALPPATHPIAVVHPMPVSAPPSSPPLATNQAVVPQIPPSSEQDASLRLLREQVIFVPESANVRREELERRLDIVEQLWQSGNLSAAVQEKIYRLAKTIIDRKFNEAMEIYTSLVANHSSECATWAIALRHIVLTIQPSSTAVAATATTTTATSDTGNVIPAMYVPAMPRQVTAADSSEANYSAAMTSQNDHHPSSSTSTISSSSSVQHI